MDEYYNVYYVSEDEKGVFKSPIALHLKSKSSAITLLLNNYFLDFDVSKRQEVHFYKYNKYVNKHIGKLSYLRKYKKDVIIVSKKSNFMNHQLYELPLQMQRQSILYPHDCAFFSKSKQFIIDAKDAPEYEDILFTKKYF